MCRRFRLEKVRFANSGTEATMDAIRVARAATGRDDVVQDRGLVPRAPRPGDVLGACRTPTSMGGRERRRRRRCRQGMPGRTPRKYTRSCRSTTPTLLERLLTERGDEIACLIIEPVMMNIGIVVPEPGYLQAAARPVHRHGVVLIFDEVKCGATIAPGGAIERYGVQPDLACFAKAIAGGTPGGGVRRARRRDGDDRARRGAAGHLQRQPARRRAAGLAALTEVLTPDAYEHFARLGDAAGRRAARQPSIATASPPTRSTSARRVRLVPARRR